MIAALLGSIARFIIPRLFQIFIGTLRRTSVSLLTIAAMLALGYTTRFGGLDASMGLAFASTGFFVPFFSPLLGCWE